MIVLACGGREYFDWYTIEMVLDLIGPERLIHGAAHGADMLVDHYARKRNIPVTAYPIRKSFENGFQRNQRMLDSECNVDLVVAFRGNNGTADMVRRARRANLSIIEVR